LGDSLVEEGSLAEELLLAVEDSLAEGGSPAVGDTPVVEDSPVEEDSLVEEDKHHLAEQGVDMGDPQALRLSPPPLKRARRVEEDRFPEEPQPSSLILFRSFSIFLSPSVSFFLFLSWGVFFYFIDRLHS